MNHVVKFPGGPFEELAYCTECLEISLEENPLELNEEILRNYSEENCHVCSKHADLAHLVERSPEEGKAPGSNPG